MDTEKKRNFRESLKISKRRFHGCKMLHPFSVAGLMSGGVNIPDGSNHPANISSFVPAFYLHQPPQGGLHLSASAEEPAAKTADDDVSRFKATISNRRQVDEMEKNTVQGLIVEHVTPPPFHTSTCVVNSEATELSASRLSAKNDDHVKSKTENDVICYQLLKPNANTEQQQKKSSSEKRRNSVETSTIIQPSSSDDDDDQAIFNYWQNRAGDLELTKDEVHCDAHTPISDQNSPKANTYNNPNDKPPHSYIALISMAILRSPSKKLVLSDIYQYIMNQFEYYNNQDRAWRNSIRHNLSLNECFIKAGRADNGKGNFWAIHPACVEDFSKGDYRRRQARRRARGILGTPGYDALAAATFPAWAYQRYASLQNPANYLQIPPNLTHLSAFSTRPFLPPNVCNSMSSPSAATLLPPASNPVARSYSLAASTTPRAHEALQGLLQARQYPPHIEHPQLSQPQMKLQLELATPNGAAAPGVSHSISSLLQRSVPPTLRYSPYPLSGTWW